MNYEQATEKMRRLEHLDATITEAEVKCARQIRAYEDELNDRLSGIRAERKYILEELERFMRTQDQLGMGRRWSCTVGELRLNPSKSWRLGLGKRATAQHLLNKGLYRCLKVAVKLSGLETLSPSIQRELQLSQQSRLTFSCRLRKKP